jgi:hypothetical protein
MVFCCQLKGPRGDMLDHCLGKRYFGGGARIPDANGEINICAPPVGPIDDVFCVEK